MYGIDLGTTNSAIFGYDATACEAKPLAKLLPSVVDYTAKRVGAIAKKNITESRGNNILSSFKVDISLDYAVDASAEVLRELAKAIPESKDVVISVPAYFNSLQRANTIKAAEKIGLKVHSLINEPTAAALYYNRMNKKVTLVYDLGGGTFDISIIDTRFGFNDVQATDGVKLGGDDLDNTLVQGILNKCGYRRHVMPHAEVIKPLKEVAESIKLQMQNTRDIVTVDLTGYGLAEAFENAVFTLKPEEYALAVKMVFGKTTNRTRKVIMDSGYDAADLSLIFVGGSTRDPFLREMIEEAIGLKAEPLTYDPDLIVAQGAAYYAWLIETGEAENKISDVTNALGFMLADGTMQVVIPKNSSIPIENKYLVHNDKESDGLTLSIYQGDSILAEDNARIGEFEYYFKDGVQQPQSVVVSVTFSVNGSGILQVKARELGGEEKVVTLKL